MVYDSIIQLFTKYAILKFDILGIKLLKSIKNQGIKFATLSIKFEQNPLFISVFRGSKMHLPSDDNFIAKYLTTIIKETGNTYESVAEKCGTSESTVKNLCSGKTENPGILTIAPIVYAANGSLDVMCGKTKEDIDEKTKNLIKEMSEFQFAEYRKTEETHIGNIRTHYEQHREDTISNYERLLSEKDCQIKFFRKLAFICFGIACIGFSILIGLLILEVSNPNLGWIKF